MTSKTTDHILIVDDDREIRELLTTYLVKNGLRVAAVPTGRHMRAALEESGPFDLIILDLMLPGEDGLTLCRDLRSGKYKATPILMLTARNEEADRILGLEMGADDYLAKPSATGNCSRLRSVLRRTRMLPPNMRSTEAVSKLAFGEWQVDTIARHLIDANGVMVALSGAEYRLLRVFLDHPRKVLSRDQLLSLTQGREPSSSSGRSTCSSAGCAIACATMRANPAISRRCAARATSFHRPSRLETKTLRVLRVVDHHLPELMPPSTGSTMPVVKLASLRYRTASTISCLVAMRPAGCSVLRKPCMSLVYIGVSTIPAPRQSPGCCAAPVPAPAPALPG